MKVLVVYDTFFNNTKQIAEAINNSINLGNRMHAKNVKEVTKNDLIGIDILVVGSPTRGFNATKPIINLLKSLDNNSLNGVRVAAFDTRSEIEKINIKILTFLVRIFGYAAEKILKKLVAKGGTPIKEPCGFFVTDTEGPLKTGEYDRASAWLVDVVNIPIDNE